MLGGVDGFLSEIAAAKNGLGFCRAEGKRGDAGERDPNIYDSFMLDVSVPAKHTFEIACALRVPTLR